MKALISGILFATLLTCSNALADQGEKIQCNSDRLLSIAGTLKGDIFESTIIVSMNGNVVLNVSNLKYKKSEDSGKYYSLVEDEVSRSVQYQNLYFVPTLLNLEKGITNIVFLWVPTLDEQGKPSPILISTGLVCQ